MLEKSGIELFKINYYSKDNLLIFFLVLAISTMAITPLFSIIISLLKTFFLNSSLDGKFFIRIY